MADKQVMEDNFKKQVLETTIAVLNDAIKADQKAVTALFEQRVPCNQALVDHPTIVCQESEENPITNEVGVLGIINGILEPLTGSRVASRWQGGDSEPSLISSFVRYEPADDASLTKQPR